MYLHMSEYMYKYILDRKIKTECAKKICFIENRRMTLLWKTYKTLESEISVADINFCINGSQIY